MCSLPSVGVSQAFDPEGPKQGSKVLDADREGPQEGQTVIGHRLVMSGPPGYIEELLDDLRKTGREGFSFSVYQGLYLPAVYSQGEPVKSEFEVTKLGVNPVGGVVVCVVPAHYKIKCGVSTEMSYSCLKPR